MSARFYVGPTPGGHALRVMKDASYDPVTTPRTDYDKFAFDSESGNLAYAYKVQDTIPDISGLDYPPVVSSMVRYEADWWDIFGSAISRSDGYDSHETCHAAGILGTASPTVVISAGAVQGPNLGPYPTVLQSRVLVWQLPADNRPMLFPSSIGSVGRFYRSGSAVRLPRVGFSISDPDPRNFILHEDVRPAKIVASGSTIIPAGQTIDVQLTGISDGTNLFVGGAVGQVDQPLVIPQVMIGDYTSNYRRVQFRFMGNGIVRFREKGGRATQLTYYIVAEDGSGYSTGDASFIQSFGEGSEAYVQIRRPGCAEPPNLSDILLDSRWPTMPLIAEGFIPKANFSTDYTRTATINFPDGDLGYRPIVLCMWHTSNSSGGGYTPGLTGYLQFNVPGRFPIVPGTSRRVAVYTDRVVFEHLMGSAPLYWSSVGSGGWVSSSEYEFNFVGVRYYVFGISQGT